MPGIPSHAPRVVSYNPIVRKSYQGETTSGKKGRKRMARMSFAHQQAIYSGDPEPPSIMGSHRHKVLPYFRRPLGGYRTRELMERHISETLVSL